MTANPETTRPLDYRATPADPRPSKAAVWIGRVLSALPVLLLLFSAYMKLSRNELAVKGFRDQNFPEGSLMAIGITEVVCTLLYVIPQTSVLGAILLTGYLGGATVTHVRLGESFFMPVLVGVVLWLGLFLRDRRLRALIPFRSR